MKLNISKISEMKDIEKDNVDRFIMDKMTNGEFINTLKYLAYHPLDRFIDDSIVIMDTESGVIKGVIMAACQRDDCKTIISHPGTTFSGLIVNKKASLIEIRTYIEMIDCFYKAKYQKIRIKNAPASYSLQPNQELDYLFARNGYNSINIALSNVIDLRNISTENVLMQYESKRRNQVRKSMRNNIFQFVEVSEVNKDIWINMNMNITEKYGSKTTHSYQEITEIKNMFCDNVAAYEVCKSDGTYGAFALIYKFKNVFHTQYLDMNYEVSVEYPNLFLIHKLIETAIREGFKYFSFGASTEKKGEYLNEGLYNYKNGFGGGSILLTENEKNFFDSN